MPSRPVKPIKITLNKPVRRVYADCDLALSKGRIVLVKKSRGTPPKGIWS